MLKKSLSFILSLIICLAVIQGSVFCEEAEFAPYEVLIDEIASDSFDYSWTPSNQTKALSSYDYGGEIAGSGWSLNWSSSISEYTAPPSSCVFQRVSGRSTISYYDKAPVYRKLENPVSFDEEGDYYFSFVAANAGNDAGNRSRGDLRFFIGDTGIYMGYKADAADNLIKPQLFSDGLIYYGEQALQAANLNENGSVRTYIFYKYIMKISVDADGTDTVSMKMFNENEDEPEGWDLTAETELAGKECDYIGYCPTVSNTHSTRFCDVFVKRINQEFLDEFDLIMEKITQGTADEADVKRAFRLAATCSEEDRQEKIDAIRTYCEENNLTASAALENISAKPDLSEKLWVQYADSIKLEYNYLLAGGSISLSEESGSAIPTEVSCDDNIVTIVPQTELMPNKRYVLLPEGLSDYKGEAAQTPISFSTSALPKVNITEGGSYSQRYKIRWIDGDGVTTEAKLVNSDGVEIPYICDTEIETSGNYKLVLVSSTQEGTETGEINFAINEDLPPVAKNVKINGASQVGEILTVSYNYSDENGDEEAESIIKWYRSKDLDGNFEHFADGESCTLSVSDVGCYIYSEVTPVSNSLVNFKGVPVKSDVFTGPFKPEALSVKTEGEAKAEEKLGVSYLYSDKNGDAEDGTVVKWFVSDTADGNGTEITENIENNQLLISEAVYGKYIYASVTPKSSGNPVSGDEVFTERILGPCAPVVYDVSIGGTVKVGNEVYAKYSYKDDNLDIESGSLFRWINAENGEVLGTGPTLNITKSMKNVELAVAVTGKNASIPYDSEEVISEAVNVGSGSSSGASGGSGGGKSYSYAGANSGSIKLTAENENTAQNGSGQEENEVFSDTKGHWAEKYIIALNEEGIVQGMGDGSFLPDERVKRAEFLTMLLRGGVDENSEYKPVFNDVKENDWFSPYVMQALSKGLISEAASFRPNDFITRQEAAKVVSLLYELKGSEVNFEDKESISDWALEYVCAAYEAGVFKGDENNCFNPVNSLTRAEAAAVIYRLKYDMKGAGADEVQ